MNVAMLDWHCRLTFASHACLSIALSNRQGVPAWSDTFVRGARQGLNSGRNHLADRAKFALAPHWKIAPSLGRGKAQR
ncbi:hypothetical protein [Agrobacterium sp. B1(2019)]|uniref:hypothetical protein n=1 Tax=Agrobacterium sp. B1(2019) TaxID=2607032 RepID=UPI0011EBA9D1|nr:hypothetical protein [Agrobacterium sp. B1(2019)]TZG32194.1 hypothetical protein AGR1_24715 [Agrobacterium sp. B1(2019)]